VRGRLGQQAAEEKSNEITAIPSNCSPSDVRPTEAARAALDMVMDDPIHRIREP
jgi:hypothetical protein